MGFANVQRVERSDYFNYGFTLVAPALAYVLSGPKGSAIAAFVGVVLIVRGHLKKHEEGFGYIPLLGGTHRHERTDEIPTAVLPKAPLVEKGPQPTLISMMDTSLPQFSKLWGSPVFHFEGGVSVQIKSALYFDFSSGTKFLGFYIPHLERDFDGLYTVLAENSVKLGDELVKSLLVIARFPGENSEALSDLTYSGKVYLYHEDVLTYHQMARVEDIFKQNGLNGILRGPDFLTHAWLAWKQKSDS
jgi:hypothetical protein